MLCNTTRALTEVNLTFNYRRIVDNIQGYGAAFATAIDRGNVRNTIAFDVRRSADSEATPVAFTDAGAAFLWAIQHPTGIPGTGILELAVPTAGGSTSIWMLNCMVETFAVPDFLGVAPLCRYSLNGGQITLTNPL